MPGVKEPQKERRKQTEENTMGTATVSYFEENLFQPEQKHEQTKKIKRLENFWSKHQTPRERSSESRSF